MMGERIRILRERAGMNRLVLAKRMGVCLASVTAWEKGSITPSTGGIVKLAELFQVSCNYLLCMETPPSLNVQELKEEDIRMIAALIDLLRKK